ncbi:hypothetical protein [Ruminococcus sp.]|uniref:hypothetical protein n=1 Tax=Ruminococcus sp. TaxID=41978 RepID=UPI003990E190
MLEVFEIYQPPQADRNKIAGKMLGHILIVFAALAVVMVKLFLCIGADSARNRDAVRKVTSPETEQWVLIMLLVFVAAVIYLSVAGFLLSRKVRRQFTAWVYNGEKLYVVTAKVPSAGRYSSPRRVSSVFQIQERALGDTARPANAGQSDRGYRFRTAVSRHAGDRGAANPAAGAGSDRVF